ncbi:MAG: diaminopimelate decarboxylase [Gemmatimonadaceae bacterium]
MGQGVLTAPYSRVGGTLSCEGVPLDALANAVGTPAYVYSSSSIRSQYQRLHEALADVPHRIHYACKANGNLAILSLLRSLGSAVDVVSGGELHRVRKAGFAPEEIIFGGVGKGPSEIAEALDAGVHILSLESEEELHLVNRLAGERGVRPRIGLRVNPEITVESVHSYIKTGQKGDKFGVPHDQAMAVALRAAALPHVQLVAIGMHIGSQVTDLQAYGAGLAKLEALVQALRSAGISTLEYVDVGGGLFVPYADEAPIDLSAYAALVAPVTRRLGLTLVIEPGRFLVAEAGILLTRVLYRKRSGGKSLLITDAGMTDLLRPSHYQAYHRIEGVSPSASQATFDVVGPICESGDFLAIDRAMDDVSTGALLCIHTAGAYGFCMASNYNARPRPVEVLVDGDRWAVVTQRERYDDLTRLETTTPAWSDL